MKISFPSSLIARPNKFPLMICATRNLPTKSADGFFQANAIFAENQKSNRPPKRVILLLDTSLSMYGDKLVRAVEAIDFFLHNLDAGRRI